MKMKKRKFIPVILLILWPLDTPELKLLDMLVNASEKELK